MAKMWIFLGVVGRSFGYVPQYFKSAAREWQSALFGEGMFAVIFTVAWAFNYLSNTALITSFVVAAIVSGYFVWRAEYIKTVPRFVIERAGVQQTTSILQTRPIVTNWIQIHPKCLTEARVNGCEGHLIRIYKKATPQSNWIETAFNEVSLLHWSNNSEMKVKLEPGAELRLNVACTGDTPIIRPDVPSLHFRTHADLIPPGIFSFDIKVTADDAPPVYVSVEVVFSSIAPSGVSCTLNQGLTKLL
jgi:hypothetical protein